MWAWGRPPGSAAPRRRATRHARDGRQRRPAHRGERDQGVRRPGRGRGRDVPGAGARDRLDHRAERSRQDDVLQHAYGAVPAHLRAHQLRRQERDRPPPRPDHEGRDGADLPEHPLVRDDDRARERDGRPELAHGLRAVRLDPQAAGRAPRGERGRGEGARDAGLRRDRGEPVRADVGEPLLRRPAPARDRPRARLGAEAAPARRADRRDEPAGVRGADRLHEEGARRARSHDPADRARHAGHHGGVRVHHRARPRPEDRRGHARGGPHQRARGRGLPRQAGREGGRGGSGAPRPRAGRVWLMALLEVSDVRTFYGNIEALKGVSLTVEEGEVVTLIGSNGAGKSTTLRSISGLTPPREGSIRFRGEEISTVPAQEIVRLGISQSPEGRHCFQRMTVRENLELGAYLRRDANVKSDMDRVFDLFPRLKEREKQKAGTMSGGEQQMLAMGRALMADPALLLLDEPSMGLAPILVERIYETVREINKQGTTILLVEQNANYALEVSKHGYVLETGRVVLADKSEALRDNPEVKSAYLGA